MSVEQTFHSAFTPEGQQALRTELQATKLGWGGNAEAFQVARVLGRFYRQGARGNLAEADGNIYAVLHGEHARVLGNKDKFAHLVRGMGYTAPDSMTVSANTPSESRAQEANTYFTEREIDHLFVKPLHGTRQRDLHETQRDSTDLEEYLSRASEDMVVQEFIPHERVLRYIRYRGKDGETFVACFSYQDPPEGIKESKIPVIGNRHIAASGETYNEMLTSLLNTSADVLERDGVSIANLNTFMSVFIPQLEQTLGGELPFTSFDIAVKNMEALQQALALPYSEEVERILRENLVFIESQSIPNPWEVRAHNTQKPMKTYTGLWRLFLKEHASEMFARMRELQHESNSKSSDMI